MSRTPGVVLPSSFSSEEELLKDLQRRSDEAGFTPFDFSELSHADKVDAFIAHYGVKGMKWGVNSTKVKSALGQRTEAVGKPAAEAKALDKTNSKAKAQKSVKALSNKELKDALERMRLEQQYSQMTGGIDKTSQQKAAGFIRGIVQSTAKQTVTNAVAGQVRSNLPGGAQQGKQGDQQAQSNKSKPSAYTPPNSDASFTVTNMGR